MPPQERHLPMLERNIKRLEGLRSKVRHNPVLTSTLQTSITTLRHLLDSERRFQPFPRRPR